MPKKIYKKPELYVTTRIWIPTLNTFREISRISGENMVDIFDRLGKRELERLRKKQDREFEARLANRLPENKND